MIEANATLSGGCRCGKIRFTATGAPLWVAHCHCADCRRATGSPMTTYTGYKIDKFAYTAGMPKRFASSAGVTRSFCGECGTPLTYEGVRWPGEMHVFVGTFDDPARFTPQAHVYVAEQIPWLKLSDDLPRFAKTAGSSGT